MSSLIASQVCCMFLLLLGTISFGVLPVFVKKKLFECECVGDTCKKNCRARKGKVITSFLIYFGGGVLLGTCLLHLLPESREGFEDHDEHEHLEDDANSTLNGTAKEGAHEHHEEFALPEFIVCCGFFAVYLFEEIVHHFLGGHSHVPQTENKAIRSFSRSSSCVGTLPRLSNASVSVSGEFKPPRPTSLTTASVELSEPPAKVTEISLSGLLTVAALSFHSLFEGFAIGLRPDAVSTWIVFAAVAVHKYVIAFVVGLEVLAGGGKNAHVYIYMTVFAFMSPIGMASAMITQSSVEEKNPVTVSVLNAIATGTLLYVTFFEILQRSEEHKDIPTWIQLVATFSGFLLMCVMQYASTLA